MKLTKRFIAKYNEETQEAIIVDLKTKIIYDNLWATSDEFDDVLMKILNIRCTDKRIKKLYQLSSNLLMNALKEEK